MSKPFLIRDLWASPCTDDVSINDPNHGVEAGGQCNNLLLRGPRPQHMYAAVQIEPGEYQEIADNHPRARLTYVDSDDGDLITVGSALELQQRLDDPVDPLNLQNETQQLPAYRVDNDEQMHFFDIRRSKSVLELWRKYEFTPSSCFLFQQTIPCPVLEPADVAAEKPPYGLLREDSTLCSSPRDQKASESSQPFYTAFQAEMAKIAESCDSSTSLQSSSVSSLEALSTAPHAARFPNAGDALANIIRSLADALAIIRSEVSSRLPELEERVDNVQRVLPEQVETTVQAALGTLEAHVGVLLNKTSIADRLLRNSQHLTTNSSAHNVFEGLQRAACDLCDIGKTLFTAYVNDSKDSDPKAQLEFSGQEVPNQSTSESLDQLSMDGREQQSTQISPDAVTREHIEDVRITEGSVSSEHKVPSTDSHDRKHHASLCLPVEGSTHENHHDCDLEHHYHPPYLPSPPPPQPSPGPRLGSCNLPPPLVSQWQYPHYSQYCPPPPPPPPKANVLSTNPLQIPPGPFNSEHLQNLGPASSCSNSLVPPSSFVGHGGHMEPFLEDCQAFNRIVKEESLAETSYDESKLSQIATRESYLPREPVIGEGFLFIGNVSYEATEEMVQNVFSSEGFPADVRLPFDSDTGQHFGFGYLRFRSPRTAKAALNELQGSLIDGLAINLEYCDHTPVLFLERSRRTPADAPPRRANRMSWNGLNEASVNESLERRSRVSKPDMILDEVAVDEEFSQRYPSLRPQEQRSFQMFDVNGLSDPLLNFLQLGDVHEMFPPVSRLEAKERANRCVSPPAIPRPCSRVAATAPNQSSCKKAPFGNNFSIANPLSGIPGAFPEETESHSRPQCSSLMLDSEMQSPQESHFSQLHRRRTVLPSTASTYVSNPIFAVYGRDASNSPRRLRRRATERNSHRSLDSERHMRHSRSMNVIQGSNRADTPTLFENYRNILRNLSSDGQGHAYSEQESVVPGRTASDMSLNPNVRRRKIVACVDTLMNMGYGDAVDGGRQRVAVYASAADGKLIDAIEMIEEERKAYEQRES